MPSIMELNVIVSWCVVCAEVALIVTVGCSEAWFYASRIRKKGDSNDSKTSF